MKYNKPIYIEKRKRDTGDRHRRLVEEHLRCCSERGECRSRTPPFRGSPTPSFFAFFRNAKQSNFSNNRNVFFFKKIWGSELLGLVVYLKGKERERDWSVPEIIENQGRERKHKKAKQSKLSTLFLSRYTSTRKLCKLK